MTGVYYRAPAPKEPPFVEVGDHIEVGQPIGLIEAMKVFSEVPSEVSGRVVEMPVKNGELVHQDQVLVVVAVEE
jgi:acetyl-CoA carboxylase biotin carboxyl carrier protein